MEDLVKVLSKILIDETKNPYLRFIVKKNKRQLKLKAFNELKVELFLHTVGRNRLILTEQQTVNTSGMDDNMVWKVMEPYLIHSIMKFVMSEDFKKLIDEYKME